jgi:RNA polymerase sigma-70 factor (ECF subfamily)
MSGNYSDESIEKLLRIKGLFERLKRLDKGKYYPLPNGPDQNPFARAHANPNVSFHVEVNTDPPRKLSVVWNPIPTKKLPGSLADLLGSDQFLAPMMAEVEDDDEDNYSEDSPQSNLESNYLPLGEFTVHSEDKDDDLEPLDLQVTPPGQENPSIAVIHPDGRLDVPDQATHQALVNASSRIESRYAKTARQTRERRAAKKKEDSAGGDEPPSGLVAGTGWGFGGGSNGFEEWYQRHETKIIKIAALCFPADQDRDNVVQEAAIVLWGMWCSSPDKRYRLDRAIRTVVTYRIYDFLRQRGRRREVSLDAPHSSDPNSPTLTDAVPGRERDPSHDIETHEETHKRLKLLDRALLKLPQSQREAIQNRYFSDSDEPLTYKEVSDLMNKTEGAIKSLLSRAKEKLREELNSMDIQDHLGR